MRFDHPDYDDTWFTVKEEPLIRDILSYDGEMTGSMAATLYPRLWRSAKWLIDEWNCEGINPDDDFNAILDRSADIRLVELVKWAGLAVFSFRQSLEPEKN